MQLTRLAWFLALGACAGSLPAGTFADIHHQVPVDDCGDLEGLNDNPGHTEVTLGSTDGGQFELAMELDARMSYEVPSLACVIDRDDYHCERAELVRTYEDQPDYRFTQTHAVSGSWDRRFNHLYVEYSRTLVCEHCNETFPERCQLDIEWVFDLDKPITPEVE